MQALTAPECMAGGAERNREGGGEREGGYSWQRREGSKVGEIKSMVRALGKRRLDNEVEEVDKAAQGCGRWVARGKKEKQGTFK